MAFWTLIVGVCLLACSGGSSESGVDSQLPEGEIQHYAGPSAWLTPEGEQMLDPGQVWLRRELRPEDSQVIEDLVSVDSGGQVNSYRVEISIENGALSGSFEESAGTVEISGTLEGEAWEWTEWSATGVYLAGDLAGYYFHSQAVLEDTELVLDKRVYDPTDVYLLHIVETLSWMDAETWETETSSLELISEGTTDSGG